MKLSARARKVHNRRRLNVVSRHARAAEPIQCPNPECRSLETEVYCSRNLPVRYHRCRACGHTFKSVEKVIRGEPMLKGDV